MIKWLAEHILNLLHGEKKKQGSKTRRVSVYVRNEKASVTWEQPYPDAHTCSKVQPMTRSRISITCKTGTQACATDAGAGPRIAPPVMS